MKTKAHSTSSFLAYLILTLVIIVVLLVFYMQLASVYRASDDVEICRKSVEVSSLSAIRGDVFVNDLRCPTLYRTITAKDTEKIKKQVADEMADCWYKFNKGDATVFPLSTWDKASQDTTYNCVICSVIEFQDDAQGKTLANFGSYLAEHQVSVRYGKESYYTYLTGYQTDTALLPALESSPVSLTTNTPYTVVLLYAKKGYIDSILAAEMGGGGTFVVAGLLLLPTGPLEVAGVAALGLLGGAGGYALGADKTHDVDAMTVIVPYTAESLSGLSCDILPVKQGKETKTT